MAQIYRNRYDLKTILLCKNWFFAPSVASTHNNKHRASAIRYTAQVDCALELRKILPEFWHIFFSLYFSTNWRLFFTEKSLSDAGLTFYWWAAHVA